MRANEFITESITYYHISMNELPVGTILTPRDNYESNWGKTSFYNTLEKYRPSNMLAHRQAVFMGDNEEDTELAAGGGEWLFTVRPLGKIEKHDLNWGSEISMIMDELDTPGREEKLKHAAQNYWSGVPHVNETLWEYLTPKAKILATELF